MTITLTVNCIPKGQPRPRAFSRGGRTRVYDPGTAESMKSAIALEALPHRSAFPIVGPIAVEIVALMPRPKSHRNTKGIKPNAPHHHTAKPDSDNIAKAVLDALTDLGAWADDAAVCDMRVRKVYTNLTPGLGIYISPIAEPSQ